MAPRNLGHTQCTLLYFTCFDNVPSHYKVEDFCREVFELLVNTPEYCCDKLQHHLDKTGRSYQRLVLDLAAGTNMNVACDFYLGSVITFGSANYADKAETKDR